MVKFFKRLIVVVSLSVIAGSGIFIALHTPNEFNNRYRSLFTDRPALRQLLALHNPPDAKRDYLDVKKYPKLSIRIFAVSGQDLAAGTKQNITERLGELTSKTVELSESEITGQPKAAYAMSELTALARENWPARETGTAYLNIFAVTLSAERPSLAGTTLDESSVAIFTAGFQQDPGRELIEESTIYHEFGHLVGFEHEPNSLMAEDAEIINGELDRQELWFNQGQLDKIQSLRRSYDA